MSWRSLFNAARPATKVGGGGGRPPGGGGLAPSAERQGAFVTPQSLTTFAGASTAVTLLWKISGLLHTGWDKSHRVALLCALVIGAVLYFISESDPNRGPIINWRDYAIDGVVALINTLVLFTAAIGVTQIAPSIQDGAPTAQTAGNSTAAGFISRAGSVQSNPFSGAQMATLSEFSTVDRR